MEKGRQQLNATILFSLLADMPKCEHAPRITSTLPQGTVSLKL